MGLSTCGTDPALRLADQLGHLLYRVDRRHRIIIHNNLRMAYPQWTPAHRDRIARESFGHFCRLVIEGINTPRLINRDAWSDYMQFDSDVGPAVDLLNQGQPILLVTGHFGNFEAMGAWLAVLGYDIAALARPIDNPLINRWLLGLRERRGLRIISKWENEISRMIGFLDQGGAIAVVSDQNAGERGQFVPFFGQFASTYKSVALLALQRRVPVVCGGARRVGVGCRFQAICSDIIYPEDWEKHPDPVFYITARYMHALETMVRACPEQYFWLHRRWKARPRFERQGKPMPATLRRNLEALPWMDQQQLDRLAVPLITPDFYQTSAATPAQPPTHATPSNTT